MTAKLTSASSAFLMSLLLAHSHATATPLRSIRPLDSIRDVSIADPIIGNPIAIPGNRTAPLFGLGRVRSDRFKTALVAAVTTHLAARSLPVDSTSTNSIAISLYGGSFESSGCQGKVFFSLQVSIGGGEKGLEITGSRGLLGVVDDADLEHEITRAVLSVLDDFLGERRAAQALSK